MSTVHVGLKLGPPQESSGLVVAEREGEQFTVRTIHRFPAGTPYTQIAQQVAAILGKLHEHSLRLYLDITGLGLPIQELVERRITDSGCSLIPVTFTYGDKLDGQTSPWVMGKLYLLSQIKMLLQEGWLFLPETEEARQLVADIKNYQPKLDEHANERYGAFQVGKRDELVTALGLAVCDRGGTPGMLWMDVDPFDPGDNAAPDPDDPYSVFWRVPR